jgi:hypothetical protein
MKKNIKRKANPGNEKLKTELKQIRTDLKKLKKSKIRMQLLWYRTKKEHVALIADLDNRLKALKKRAITKTQAKRSIVKPITKKRTAKKPARKRIIRKTRKSITPKKKK